MSHPKEAWKFKLWTEAMLRGATVGDPEYKAKGKSPSKSTFNAKARRKRRRKRRHRAKKES